MNIIEQITFDCVLLHHGFYNVCYQDCCKAWNIHRFLNWSAWCSSWKIINVKRQVNANITNGYEEMNGLFIISHYQASKKKGHFWHLFGERKVAQKKRARVSGPPVICQDLRPLWRSERFILFNTQRQAWREWTNGEGEEERGDRELRWEAAGKGRATGVSLGSW